MAGQEELPRPRPGVWRELLARRRLTLVLAVLLIELAILLIAASLPVNQATQQALQSEAKTLSGTTSNLSATGTFVFILTHNATIAFGEMIPVLGAVLWFVSIYTTGQIIQVIALSQGASGLLYGVLILLFPFTIVELSAYAVAVASGTMLIVAWRRQRLRSETRVLVLEVAIAAALLSCAAAMETLTILSPIIGLALWVPTGIVIAALVIVTNRSETRAEPFMSERPGPRSPEQDVIQSLEG